MSYIYSGYGIAFGVLGAYTALLCFRRAKLEKLAAKTRAREMTK